MARIASCRKTISQWKRSAKPNSAIRIQALHHRLDLATRDQFTKPEELLLLRRELNEEYYNEEIFWRQKSRINWLKAGDRNTRFFHAVTKNRRARNCIQSLIDEEGKEWFEEQELGRVA